MQLVCIPRAPLNFQMKKKFLRKKTRILFLRMEYNGISCQPISQHANIPISHFFLKVLGRKLETRGILEKKIIIVLSAKENSYTRSLINTVAQFSVFLGHTATTATQTATQIDHKSSSSSSIIAKVNLGNSTNTSTTTAAIANQTFYLLTIQWNISLLFHLATWI